MSAITLIPPGWSPSWGLTRSCSHHNVIRSRAGQADSRSQEFSIELIPEDRCDLVSFGGYSWDVLKPYCRVSYASGPPLAKTVTSYVCVLILLWLLAEVLIALTEASNSGHALLALGALCSPLFCNSLPHCRRHTWQAADTSLEEIEPAIFCEQG